MYFLVNASPNLLDVAISNYAGKMPYDLEGTGQCFV